jgi:5-methylcytosine-specific restriction endonuclease McrA
MRDRRYSTQAWRRLRARVIARAGGRCEVKGPRCIGIASSAHHILPSSQYPEAFWDLSNLQAACAPCNHHGAVTKSENRANRQTIAVLEDIVENQERLIGELFEALSAYENGRTKATRRIY